LYARITSGTNSSDITLGRPGRLGAMSQYSILENPPFYPSQMIQQLESWIDTKSDKTLSAWSPIGNRVLTDT
jgi:hypothetical protein